MVVTQGFGLPEFSKACPKKVTPSLKSIMQMIRRFLNIIGLSVFSNSEGIMPYLVEL